MARLDLIKYRLVEHVKYSAPILAQIILPVIRHASLWKDQLSFKPNRRCVEHIITIHFIEEYSVEWNSLIYLLFIDIKNEFDMIQKYAIWNTLHNIGVSDT